MAELSTTAVGILIFVIVVTISGALVNSVQKSQCTQTVVNQGWDAGNNTCYANATTVSSNISGYGTAGMQTYGSWVGIIVLVTVAGFIIAYLKGAFQ